MSRTSSVIGSVTFSLLVLASVGVVVRAASLTTRYQAEVQRLRGEWQAQQQTEGLSGRDQQKALYGKYPTPELALKSVTQVAPGKSAPLAVTGTFGAKTAFLLEHDQVTLSNPSASANAFSATVTAAADAVPGFVRLYAYAPVSGAWRALPAVLIGVPPTFSLTAGNGWTITMTPQAPTFTVSGNSASVSYKADFRKPGETAPFETAMGSVTLDGGSAPSDRWTLSLNSGAMGGAMEDMQAIQAQMSDANAFMKMTDKQRDALMARMEAVTERLTKEAEANIADPGAAQRKEDAFGCQYVALTLGASDVSGSINCGKDVGTLQVTGTRR